MLPKEICSEIHKYDEESFKVIEKNPWLIPATLAWITVPTAICLHGFWKNRQLKKQLKIEREKTKQLTLTNYHEHNLRR